jgi:hypothetical protein
MTLRKSKEETGLEVFLRIWRRRDDETTKTLSYKPNGRMRKVRQYDEEEDRRTVR